MNRSLFLTLAGTYSLLLAAGMLLFTTATLQTYGVPNADLDHFALLQFLGLANAMLGFVVLALRRSPNSYPLRVLMLGQAVQIIGGVLLGVYHIYGLHVPNNQFFVIESLFRLALGLGYLYYYIRAAKQPQMATAN